MADGLGSAIVALIGGLSNTSWQSVQPERGVRLLHPGDEPPREWTLTATDDEDRSATLAVVVGIVFLILRSFILKLAAIIGAMPQPVRVGAATVADGRREFLRG